MDPKPQPAGHSGPVAHADGPRSEKGRIKQKAAEKGRECAQWGADAKSFAHTRQCIVSPEPGREPEPVIVIGQRLTDAKRREAAFSLMMTTMITVIKTVPHPRAQKLATGLDGLAVLWALGQVSDEEVARKIAEALYIVIEYGAFVVVDGALYVALFPSVGALTPGLVGLISGSLAMFWNAYGNTSDAQAWKQARIQNIYDLVLAIIGWLEQNGS